jgi:DNA repair photolyase
LAETIEHINNIHSKLQLLLRQYDHLLKENSRQQQEITRLQQERELDKEKLEQYTQQNLILKASVTSMDEKEKKDLEQKISQYVKNIDQCISLLSQ